MKILDRYSSAVRSANLKSEPVTTNSDTDVLGAMGLAGKRNALAVALTRLLAGDNSAAGEIVRILAASAVGKAWRSDRLALSQVEAQDMARGVLAWYRHGTCTACGGHGYLLIEGTRAIGGRACPKCRGTGRVLFDQQWPMERVLLARWLLAEVEREQAIAGAAAMAALAPRLDL